MAILKLCDSNLKSAESGLRDAERSHEDPEEKPQEAESFLSNDGSHCKAADAPHPAIPHHLPAILTTFKEMKVEKETTAEALSDSKNYVTERWEAISRAEVAVQAA